MKTFQEFMLVVEGVRPGNVEAPLNMKKYNERRKSLAGKEERYAARSIGHEEPSTGRTYSTDEARSRRRGIHTDRLSPERAARHRANVDPDDDRGPASDERNYPGGRLRPNKERKARALGEK